MCVFYAMLIPICFVKVTVTCFSAILQFVFKSHSTNSMTNSSGSISFKLDGKRDCESNLLVNGDNNWEADQIVVFQEEAQLGNCFWMKVENYHVSPFLKVQMTWHHLVVLQHTSTQ